MPPHCKEWTLSWQLRGNFATVSFSKYNEILTVGLSSVGWDYRNVLCASHLNLDQSILSAYIKKRVFAFNFCVGLVEYILVTVMVHGRKEHLKQ